MLTPSVPSNGRPACVPTGKSYSARVRDLVSRFPFGGAGFGRGRQPGSLYVSHRAGKTSSCNGVKLSLISSSSSHSDSAPL